MFDRLARARRVSSCWVFSRLLSPQTFFYLTSRTVKLPRDAAMTQGWQNVGLVLIGKAGNKKHPIFGFISFFVFNDSSSRKDFMSWTDGTVGDEKIVNHADASCCEVF